MEKRISSAPQAVSRNSRRQLLAAVLVCIGLAQSAPAALKVWTGNGLDATWDTAANWSPVGAPENNDDLSFPAGAAQPVNTNNLVGRTFSSITFSGAAAGYVLRGNPIGLAGGINAAHTAGLNTVTLAITKAAAQTYTATAGGALAIEGALELNGFALVLENSADISITGTISGGGSLTKNGSGTLVLDGANTFSGGVTVNGGTVFVDHDEALGGTASGVTVNSGARLLVRNNTHVGNEPVTINGNGPLGDGAFGGVAGSNSWAGPVTLAGASAVSSFSVTDHFVLAGAIDGPGSLTKLGAGVLTYAGLSPNTYTNTTTVGEGTLRLAKGVGNGALNGPVIVGDGIGGPNADVLQTALTTQIPDSVGVTVASSGVFEVNVAENFGSLAGSGNVHANQTVAVGFNNTSTTFSGVISGPGQLQKQGSGTLILTGDNTYNGATSVAAGTLLVNGVQSQSPVTVGPGATLGGTGTVGILTVLGDVTAGSPGVLTSSNLVLTSTGAYRVELNGLQPGTGHDQLDVRGTVSLGNAALQIDTAFTSAVNPGDQFVIISNDGADLVNGIFGGLSDGALIAVDGHLFVIHYGNDVVLTLTSAVAVGGTNFVTGGNGDGVIDSDECNFLSLVLSNSSDSAMSGITATLSTVTPAVVITQPYSEYADIAGSASGTNQAPFQISTLSQFPCGTNIVLELAVATASHGNFVVPFVLSTSCSPGGGSCEACLPAIAGEINGADAVQSGQWIRDEIVGSCASPKPWGGTDLPEATFHYDVHTFTNTTAAEGCVTVQLQSGWDVMAAAYLDDYDPLDLSNNFLGNGGYSTAGLNGATTFSFGVPAGARFVVVVNEANPGAGTQPYTLTLFGLPCPPPVLAIEPIGVTKNVRLHWPTWAFDYDLEVSGTLSLPAWMEVADEPVLTGNRFTVTNSTLSTTNRFYRLHRP